MRNVLMTFGYLRDSDIEWIAGSGRMEKLAVGDVLVREGGSLDALYVLLDGELGVSKRSRRVAVLRPGDFVGEMSFVAGSVPSATVTAELPTVVIRISRADLAFQIERDEGFSARLHRALCVLLAERLRSTTADLARAVGGAEDAEDDEISMDLLDGAALAARRFEQVRRRFVGSA